MTELVIKTLDEAKQACFTGAVRGLRYQGWEMCQVDGDCAWNKGAPGIHCAIGWLIPWPNQRELALLLQTARNAIKNKLLAPILQGWLDNASEADASALYTFMSEMQLAHDSQPDMCFSLKQLGVNNNLKWPEEDADSEVA